MNREREKDADEDGRSVRKKTRELLRLVTSGLITMIIQITIIILQRREIILAALNSAFTQRRRRNYTTRSINALSITHYATS